MTRSPESQVGTSAETLKVEQKAPRGTVAARESVSAPGKYWFQVGMREKGIKTAVGFMSKGQTTEYMRDQSLAGEAHVSFGGAGWIHPKELKASLGYKEGDTVRAEVDFDQKKIRFFVNETLAGQDEWTHPEAFPAISVDTGGGAELDVTFGPGVCSQEAKV
eukprot:CAMPEP_0184305672 /NCGR_PEP_ID=MMETSP1049-20130417/14888_1 /TAXON_ID=77928 /ORGANISM="Proteomonas sulcata, Strain CCMP704" /LENGTH=161 /DNA_ID=CAMNT_0026617787 /DNA_START=9 /DNA_END=494 /DNA_ORIENTATION=-